MYDKMMEESFIKIAAVQNQSSLMGKWYEHSLRKKKRFCLLNVLLRVRNLFLFLIFTGVAPLIWCFAMNFKFIFSIQFFLCNRFYFQYLLSQNTVNVNFQYLFSQITNPMVFCSFKSINDF